MNLKKKISLAMAVSLAVSALFATPLQTFANNEKAETKPAEKSTTDTKTEEVVDENLDDEATDDETLDEETADESEAQAVSNVDLQPIETSFEVGTEEVDGEEKTVTTMKMTIDPSIIKDNTTKSKVQFNLCGWNTADGKCLTTSELGLENSQYVQSVSAKKADGEELPVQLSVINESGELTKLGETKDLVKEENSVVTGYNFYNMVVDLGESDTITEPITLEVKLLGDHSDYKTQIQSKENVSAARLAVIDNVKNILNYPINFAPEPVEEPTPTEEPVKEETKVEEVKKVETGAEEMLGLGILAVAAGAVWLYRKQTLKND